MTDRPIDVWDVETFDPGLTAILADHADQLLAYHARAQKIFLDHDLGRARTLSRPGNPHADAYSALRDQVGAMMQARTIRAWHATRPM